MRSSRRSAPRTCAPEPERRPSRSTPRTAATRSPSSASSTSSASPGRAAWDSARQPRVRPFSAWLFRIAHNLAMDHFRASRRWQPEEEVPEPPGETEPSAELAAFQSIGRQSMLELIENLSQEQKQVLTLKFVFNLPNGEVATILGKTEGAIKSLQHRALVSLEKQIHRP